MKRYLVALALCVAVLFFTVGARAADEPVAGGSHQHSAVSSEIVVEVTKDPPELLKETVVTYSAVQCGYYKEFKESDKIACGLFPLKQGFDLLMGSYVDSLEPGKIAEIVVAAGVKHIEEFSYQESNVKNLDIPFESIRGVNEDFVPDDWQEKKIAFVLRPLVKKLQEVRPSIEKLGPRAFELLLKETRDAALSAFVNTLDPHTEFLPLGSDMRKNFIEYERSVQEHSISDVGGEKVGGIGVALDNSFGMVYVIMPFAGTPATKQLEPYDEILEIDGKPVHDLKDATVLLGKPGASVNLIIRRRGVKMGMTLVREEIKLTSAAGYSYNLGNTNVCHLLLTDFNETTQNEAKVVLQEGACAVSDNLVVDLRWNRGGLGDAATNVAQMILPPQEKGAKPELLWEGRTRWVIRKIYRDSAMSIRAWKSPIVFLQSGYTASAAELLIGMVGPHAVKIGGRTYGKFSGWESVLLADGSVLILTGATAVFPGMDNLQNKGFVPDIYFPRERFGHKESVVNIEREENLLRHRGGAVTYTAQEKLLMFVGENDPEFAFGLGMFMHPDRFFSGVKGQGK